MVVSTAPHGPRDHVHDTGVTVANAPHHPLRKRDLRVSQLPFIAPVRVEWVAARAIEVFEISSRDLPVVRGDLAAATARGPPIG